MKRLRRSERPPNSRSNSDAKAPSTIPLPLTATLGLNQDLSEAIGYMGSGRPALVARLRTHQDAINAAVKRALAAAGER